MNKEKLFLPTKFLFLMEFITVLIMFFIGTAFLLSIPEDFINGNPDLIYTLVCKFSLIFLFFPTPFYFINTKSLLYNAEENYFKLGKRIIYINDILGYKIKYGFTKIPKHSIFAVIVYIVLKSGEKVSFDVFFRGADSIVKKQFEKLNILKL